MGSAFYSIEKEIQLVNTHQSILSGYDRMTFRVRINMKWRKYPSAKVTALTWEPPQTIKWPEKSPQGTPEIFKNCLYPLSVLTREDRPLGTYFPAPNPNSHPVQMVSLTRFSSPKSILHSVGKQKPTHVVKSFHSSSLPRNRGYIP